MRDAGALGLAGTAAFDGLALLGPLEGNGTDLRRHRRRGCPGGAAGHGARCAGNRTARPGTEADFVSALSDVHLVDYTQDVPAQVKEHAPDGVDAVLHLAGDLTELITLVRDGGAAASALATPEPPENRTAESVAAPKWYLCQLPTTEHRQASATGKTQEAPDHSTPSSGHDQANPDAKPLPTLPGPHPGPPPEPTKEPT